MVSISRTILDNCIKSHATEFEKQRKEILHNINQAKVNYYDQFDHKQKRFVRKIINKLAIINLMTLDEHGIKAAIIEIGKTPNPTKKIKLINQDKKKIGDASKISIAFQDLLIANFNYAVYRGNFYPRLFTQLKIRACVYCNSQLTLNVEKNTYTTAGNLNGTIKVAKYQLDHVYSKTDYPYLSATIFNLYPCCGVCNNIKRKKNVNFRLYTDNISLSPYKFSLTKESLTKYMISYDAEQLDITFEDPDKPNPNKVGKGSLEDTFHISSIYNAQKDIAEEIIVRAQIYNDTYRKELEDSFNDLFPGSRFSMERIFLGTFPDPGDIHLRPMSKFIQDIAFEIAKLNAQIN